MSPTVIDEDGYRIIIHTNDHNPPHVHVKRDDAEARIKLDPIEIWESEGFTNKKQRAILELVKKHHKKLLNKWNELQSKR